MHEARGIAQWQCAVCHAARLAVGYSEELCRTNLRGSTLNKTMKAAVLRRIGAGLAIETVPRPDPGPGEEVPCHGTRAAAFGGTTAMMCR